MSSTTVPPSLSDTSAIVRIYGAHPFHTDGDLLALAFAPDGTLWSVEDAGVVRHWNLAAQRQIGWHHLEELATLWAYSPDARLLASGSDELTVWDVASGEALVTWPQPEWVTALAFHPHLDLLATGHDDHVVRLWDITKHKPIHEFRAHHAAISAIAFSVDGKKLATAGEDKTIHLWDLEVAAASRAAAAVPETERRTGHSGPARLAGPTGSLVGHTDRIPALAWHPDGKRLVSAGWDTTARVWNVETCEPIILLNIHATQVHTLALNHDGTRLASADSANTVRLWDMERNRTVTALPEQGNEIRCLAFSADGHILVSGGAERVLHVWDVRQQRDEDTMSDSLLSRTALAVRGNGKQLASLGAGTSLRVWDTTSGDSELSLENARVLRAFAASPDGAWFAASLADEDAPLETATLGLWDAATGKRQRLLEGPKPPITTLAFAPDSTRLASSGHQTTDVWLWQIPSGQPILLIPNATNGCSVEALAWHPQGRLLACAGIDWLSTSGSDGQVTLWDVHEGTQIVSSPGGATAVAFHPSGKKVAATTLKHTVRVWEIDSNRDARNIQELIGHFDAVTCLAYSPDGSVLATGGDDHTVRLWDAERGIERGLIELDTQIEALAFSPDGKYLYTGNGNTSCYQLDVRQFPTE